jgi:hypothetical protein
VPSVEVVIPWLPGCVHRTRALGWVSTRHPYPVTVGHGSTPWVKADAVMPAVRESTADIIVVSDADVWCDMTEAIEAVKCGAPWAKPHRDVYRLTEQATADFYGGADYRDLPLDRAVYRGIAGGGVVVAKRTTLLDIPLDPRFVGWGQEDESWALALHTVAGMAYLGTEDLIHLWHPPQPRMSERKGSPESWHLMRRYAKARRDPEQMRSILKEIHALEPTEPTVRDSAPRPVRG